MSLGARQTAAPQIEELLRDLFKSVQRAEHVIHPGPVAVPERRG
jgi:hypothetical protein